MVHQLRARPWRLLRLLLALPALLGYPLGLTGRGGLKAAFARVACGGLTRAQVAADVARYLERVFAAELFPGALAAVAAHRAAGDYLVLLSASPDLYVPAIGRRLGFDEVLCTQFGWRAERFTGELLTANRRGEEKLRCLTALRAAHPGLAVSGYGNSPADLAHLTRCESATYVNPRGTDRPRLESLGLHTVDWA